MQIPTSSEGLQWYQYVRSDILEQELEGKIASMNKFEVEIVQITNLAFYLK